MTVASVPFKLANTIAVTYTCSVAHKTVRYWRIPCKIHREVRCEACKGLAWIPESEHLRHHKLHDNLGDWLEGPPPYRVIHRYGDE